MSEEKTKVVVRWFGDHWGLAHSKSYQNAFRSTVNKFKTRGEACQFARDNNCVVEKHSYDRLQDY